MDVVATTGVNHILVWYAFQMTPFEFCVSQNVSYVNGKIDKINGFDYFLENVDRQFSDFMKKKSDNNITLFNVNEIGNRVVFSMTFMRVDCLFASLKFLRAENLGYEVPFAQL